MSEIPQETAFKQAFRHRSQTVPLAATAPSMRGGMYPAAGGVALAEEGEAVTAPTMPHPANTVVIASKFAPGSVFTIRSQGGDSALGQKDLSIGHATREVQLLKRHENVATLDVQTSVSPRQQLRVPGEIALFKRIMERWGFNDGEAAVLLGYEGTHPIIKLYSGVAGLTSRDEKDRARAILRIATDLRALLRDEVEIRKWLREPKSKLGGKSACDLLLEGSMENLLRVKQFVAHISGR